MQIAFKCIQYVDLYVRMLVAGGAGVCCTCNNNNILLMDTIFFTHTFFVHLSFSRCSKLIFFFIIPYLKRKCFALLFLIIEAVHIYDSRMFASGFYYFNEIYISTLFSFDLLFFLCFLFCYIAVCWNKWISDFIIIVVLILFSILF